MDASYRFGIEEEFFLADASTRGTPRRSVVAFHAEVHKDLPKVERELLQAQVEIASPPSTDFDEARAVLSALRRRLADIGRNHGILVLASGTHPVARWARQRHTRKARYEALIDEMQMLGRRNMVCGMHVHVEVPRPEDRIDLMNRLLPYTPLGFDKQPGIPACASRVRRLTQPERLHLLPLGVRQTEPVHGKLLSELESRTP